MASTPPNAKFRKAISAITFAHRIASASAKRDDAVIEAVTRAVPEFQASRPPRRPSAPVGVGRLMKDERTTHLEDAGTFESRLGLKQRAREQIAHGGALKSPLASMKSPLATGRSAVHTSPVPVRRQLNSGSGMRSAGAGTGTSGRHAPSAGSPGFRSPIAHERKLADMDDFADGHVSDEGSVSSSERDPVPDLRKSSGGSLGLAERRPSFRMDGAGSGGLTALKSIDLRRASFRLDGASGSQTPPARLPSRSMSFTEGAASDKAKKALAAMRASGGLADERPLAFGRSSPVPATATASGGAGGAGAAGLSLRPAFPNSAPMRRVPREFEDSKLDDSAPRAFSREDVSMAAKLGKQALLSALK